MENRACQYNGERMHRSIPRVALLALLVGTALGVPSAWLHMTIPGRTVHNSHYLAASFLYQLQTMLGADSDSPSVMDGKIVQRQGKELYIDLDRLAPGPAGSDIEHRPRGIDADDLASRILRHTRGEHARATSEVEHG